MLNIFFSKSDFCTISAHFMFGSFLLQLNMGKRLLLWVLKSRKKSNWRRKTKFALTRNFPRVIRVHPFSGRDSTVYETFKMELIFFAKKVSLKFRGQSRINCDRDDISHYKLLLYLPTPSTTQ